MSPSTSGQVPSAGQPQAKPAEKLAFPRERIKCERDWRLVQVAPEIERDADGMPARLYPRMRP